MRTFLKYILYLVVVCFSLNTQAQTTTYPLQLNAMMLPPYTNCLGDYVSQGNSRLKLTAIVRDMTRYGNNLKISVSLKVKMGNTVLLETKSPYPQVLTNVGVQTPIETADLFDPKNSNARGKYANNGWCLPEGAYEFEFQIFDYYNTKLPLSEPVSMYCYLNQGEPPVGIQPISISDDDCWPVSNPNILFTWSDAVASGLSQKTYTLSVYEAQDYTMVANMFGKQDMTGYESVYEKTDIMINSHTVQPTTSFPIAGKTYMWRVTVNPQYDSYNSSSDSYYSAYKNNGHSQWYAFTYGCKEPEPAKVDLTVKPEIVSFEGVEGDKSAGTVTWKNDDQFCGYVIKYQNKENKNEAWASIDVTNDRTDNEDGTYSYTLKNLAAGETFLATVVGILECGENQKVSGESDQKELTLEAIVIASDKKDEDCKINLDPVQNSDIKELKNGECFYANGNWVRIDDISYSNGTFTGTGVYSFSVFKNVVGVNVEFKNVKINESRELIQGDVKAISDPVDNMMLDINSLLNKSNTGGGEAQQQSTISTIELTEDELKAELAKESSEYEGKLLQTGDKVYTIEKVGDKLQQVSLGEVVDQEKFCPPMSAGVDDENGYVKFSAKENWNPPFDYECNPFCNNISVNESYKKEDGYGVPWIAMAEDHHVVIKAELKDGLSVDDDFGFYCYTTNKTIKLESKETSTKGVYDVSIFAGDAGKALYIFAMKQTNKNSSGEGADCSGTKTLGRAQIFTCEKKEHKIKLVPVFESITVEVSKIQEELNKLYGPLGQTFVVESDDVFNDASIDKYSVSNAFELDETDAFRNESQAMKDLRKAYKSAKGDATKGYNAFIFILPKHVASNQSVAGEMPRSSSVGYVFTSSNTYTDNHTLAHEIGHGLFSLEHTFSIFKDLAQGSTDNLMDYNNGTNLKYWQWSLVNNPKSYVMPFMDDAEDAQLNPLAKCALQGVGSGVMSSAFDQAFAYAESENFDDYYSKVDVFQETVNFVSNVGSGVIDQCADQFGGAWKTAQVIKDVVVPLKDLAFCLNNGSKPASCCVMDLGVDYLSNFLLGPIVEKVYDKVALGNNNTTKLVLTTAALLDGFGIPNILGQEMARGLVNGVITGSSAKKTKQEILKNVTADLLKSLCQALDPIDIVAKISVESKGDDMYLVQYTIYSSNIRDFSLDYCLVNGKKCSDGGKIEDYSSYQITKQNIVYQDIDEASLGDRFLTLIKNLDGQADYGQQSVPPYKKRYNVLVHCKEGEYKQVEFIPNPSFESNSEQKKKAVESLTRVAKPCTKVEEKCECVLTNKIREKFGLSQNAYLDKTNMVVIEPKCPNNKRKYVCQDCDIISVEDACTVRLTDADRTKFNLPSNAKLSNGKVKFSTDCCDFEFSAEIECCEIKNVKLNVPDTTIVGNKVYMGNKLKNFSDIKWPSLYIDCQNVMINGVKHTYEEYFTQDLVFTYYIQVVNHLMAKANPWGTNDSFERTLIQFCQNGTVTYTSDWFNVQAGKYVTDMYNKKSYCYGSISDQTALYNNVINDLKAYAKNQDQCGRIPLKCLLSEIIRSMSTQLLSLPSSDASVSDGKINLKYSDWGAVSYSLDKYEDRFKNSLSIVLTKLYYMMYHNGQVSWNTSVTANNNFIVVFGSFTKNTTKWLSLPYNLLNSKDCCK